MSKAIEIEKGENMTKVTCPGCGKVNFEDLGCNEPEVRSYCSPCLEREDVEVRS